MENTAWSGRVKGRSVGFTGLNLNHTKELAHSSRFVREALDSPKQEIARGRKGHIVAAPHLFFRICVKNFDYSPPTRLTKKSNNGDIQRLAYEKHIKSVKQKFEKSVAISQLCGSVSQIDACVKNN